VATATRWNATAAGDGTQGRGTHAPGVMKGGGGDVAGRHAWQPTQGALHAAAMVCAAPAPGPARAVAPLRRVRGAAVRASASPPFKDSQPRFENVNVFTVDTEKLPGGDKLSNEGILGFVIAGFLAIWLGSTTIKTVAVMIGFIFTTAKYFVMGIALVLIGVAVS